MEKELLLKRLKNLEGEEGKKRTFIPRGTGL